MSNKTTQPIFTYLYTFKIIHIVSKYINGIQIVWIPSNSKLY